MDLKMHNSLLILATSVEKVRQTDFFSEISLPETHHKELMSFTFPVCI